MFLCIAHNIAGYDLQRNVKRPAKLPTELFVPFALHTTQIVLDVNGAKIEGKIRFQRIQRMQKAHTVRTTGKCHGDTAVFDAVLRKEGAYRIKQAHPCASPWC